MPHPKTHCLGDEENAQLDEQSRSLRSYTARNVAKHVQSVVIFQLYWVVDPGQFL